MAGLSRTICQRIAFILSASLLAGALGPVVAVNAQTGDAVRADVAAYTRDGQLTIHASVPRGQAIEAASLTVGSETITLQAGPEPLPAVRWFVLDSSGSMINIYTTVKAALQRFLHDNPDDPAGFIVYGRDAQIWQPTQQEADINTTLAGYSAVPGVTGCLDSALQTLEEIPAQDGMAVHTLLIAGPSAGGGSCAAPSIQSLHIPVDVIVVADVVDDVYNTLAQSTGGEVRRANLRTVEARLSEVEALWDSPIYALTGTLPPGTTGDASLALTLSGGAAMSATLTLDHFTTQPADSSTGAADTSPGLERVPPSTEVSETQQADVAVAEATQGESLAPATPIAAATQSAGQAPAVAEAPTAIAVAPTAVAVAPTAAIESVAPASADTTQDAAPAQVDQAPPEVPAAVSMDLLLGGGMLLAVVIGIVAYVFISQRRRRAAMAYTMGMTSTEDTENTSAYDFYATTGRLQHDTLSLTPELDDEDEVVITQVLSNSDFKKVQASSSRQIVGWLRLYGTVPEDYELRPPGATIGRKETCDIVIDDDRVSAEHVRLEVTEEGRVIMRVISPNNPVVVRGVGLRGGQSRILRPRDVLQLSPDTRLAFIARVENDYDVEVTQI